MILVDANILLYAYTTLSRQHAAARSWLEKTLSSPAAVRFAWTTILAFLRIGTNPRLSGRPLEMAEAAAIVDQWLNHPTVGIIAPGERHWQILRTLLEECQVRGPLTSDAHLAALAIEHGATLFTTDRDFARFTGLRMVNPIES